jgi:4-amino-4-deoxy-L-arabinose transferase-like glycosyltransferase
MQTRLREKVNHLPAMLLVLVAAWLRLANLGYSDYQGDETKALFLPQPGQGLYAFLIGQRRGPFQFLITALVKLINPDYTNYLLVRLPFALAGLAAVYFFYRLVELHFGRKIALYASLLMAVNGLFIGLSRVVQYQSLVMLFSILTLYCFSLAVYRSRWRAAGIAAGILFWAAAQLSHYDGVFITPFALYLLYRWFSNTPALSVRSKLAVVGLSGTAAALLLAAVYVPMFLSVSSSTETYWAGRLTDTEGSLSSSIVTFQVYNPLLALSFYTIGSLLSLIKIRKFWPVITWFLFPWLILEGILFDPGTHIYNYLLPAVILVAAGITVVEEAAGRWIHARQVLLPVYASLALVLVFFFALAHFMFVSHTPEYLGMERRVLFWDLGITDAQSRFKLWIYGFPYNRHWDEIRTFIHQNPGNGFYSATEDKVISGYYLSDYTFDIDQSGYFINIINSQGPHSMRGKEKIRYWTNHYQPVAVFKNNDQVVAEIYKMPAGTIEEIISAGY